MKTNVFVFLGQIEQTFRRMFVFLGEHLYIFGPHRIGIWAHVCILGKRFVFLGQIEQSFGECQYFWANIYVLLGYIESARSLKPSLAFWSLFCQLFVAQVCFSDDGAFFISLFFDPFSVHLNVFMYLGQSLPHSSPNVRLAYASCCLCLALSIVTLVPVKLELFQSFCVCAFERFSTCFLLSISLKLFVFLTLPGIRIFVRKQPSDVVDVVVRTVQ